MPAALPTDQVFINCPFDDDYAPLFRALVFVIFACGFQPRSARELDDAGQTRIDKLFAIIRQCRYGVHDVSRTDLDPEHHLPRFNMPLELGMFLGARKYGNEEQRLKRVLILDTEQYRYQRFISDLAGMDIHAHGGDATTTVRRVRNWLNNVSRKRLPSGNRVVALYDNFLAALPAIAADAGFDLDDIPYVDFESIVVDWLLTAPAP